MTSKPRDWADKKAVDCIHGVELTSYLDAIAQALRETRTAVIEEIAQKFETNMPRYGELTPLISGNTIACMIRRHIEKEPT